MEDQRLIRISYTNKGTIPSGIAYSNISPSYTETREIYVDSQLPDEEVNVLREEQLKQMKEYIDTMIKRDFKDQINFATRDECPETHYRVIDGVKYPRVTKIITPDTPKIPYIEEHAEIGNLLDEVVKIYAQTGKYVYIPFEDKGNIKCKWDEVFQLMWDWLQLHGDKCIFTDCDISLKNDEHMYCGEADLYGSFDNIYTLFDVKKTEKLGKAILEKYFMQIAAYAMCCELRPKQVIIISPYNEPIIESDVEKYFEMFLEKREIFRRRFGI